MAGLQNASLTVRTWAANMRCVLIGRCLKSAPWMEYTGNQAQIALVAAGERGAIHPGGLSVFVFWDRQEEEAAV